MEQQVTRRSIERVIRKLGFRYSHDGTDFLVESVLICVREPDALNAVTKRVYPVVAKQAGKKWKAVERNMRTAMESFWKFGNREYLNQLAGFDLRVQPTVGEVINYITGYFLAEEWDSPE